MKATFRMRKWVDIGLCGLFLLAIGFPLCAHFLGLGHGMETTENRRLAEKPTLPETKKELLRFPEKFNAFLNDQFGFRGYLLHLQSRIRWQLGLQVHPDVLMGKEGWLFLAKRNQVVEQYRGIDRFNPDELEWWVRELELREEWLAERGIPLIVIVPPNKHTVYPEYLPETVGPVVGKTRLDQISDYVQNHTDLEFIDLRGPMLEAKQSSRVFYKTDTHWNDMGGFIGYQELMRPIKMHFPAIQILDRNHYGCAEEDRPGGDLAGMIGLSDFMSERVPLLNPEFATGVRDYKVFREGKTDLDRVFYFTTCHSNRPKAVVLHDSFIWSMVKFLKESFHKVVFAHHRDLEFDTKLIEREKPDVVIYELVERSLRRRIPDSRQFLHMVSFKEAEPIISRSDPEYQNVTFGKRFSLLGARLKEVESGLEIVLAWESLKDQRLVYANAVHLVNGKGEILKVLDYPQSKPRRHVKSGTIWLDRIEIAGQKLNRTAAVAIGIYTSETTKLLRADKGPRDWNGKKLWISLPPMEKGTVAIIAKRG